VADDIVVEDGALEGEGGLVRVGGEERDLMGSEGAGLIVGDSQDAAEALLSHHGHAEQGARAEPLDEGVACQIILFGVVGGLRRAGRERPCAEVVPSGEGTFPALGEADLAAGERLEVAVRPGDEQGYAGHVKGLRGRVGDGGCDAADVKRGGDTRADPGEIGHLQQAALHVLDEEEVLDADGGLRGEGDDELAARGVEDVPRGAEEEKGAHWLTADAERDAHHALDAGFADRRCVGDGQATRGVPEEPARGLVPSVLRRRQECDILDLLAGVAEALGRPVPERAPIFGEEKEATFGLEEMDR